MVRMKTLRTVFRFAFKYRQTSGTTAGVSLRTAEFSRSIHSPSIKRQGYDANCHHSGPFLDSKYEGDGRYQAFETLRRLGVQFSVENRKSFVKNSIDDAYLCGEGRAQIMSAFKFLKEEGLSIDEGMYSSCLCYLIEDKMEEEFKFLVGILKDEIPHSAPGLGYYEMLLWIELNDEKKIEEIGRRIIDRWDKLSSWEVNYLGAFCATDNDEFLNTLLKTVDITKASSFEQLAPIFEYLGRSQSLFGSFDAKKLLEKLKTTLRLEYISHLIFLYATSIEYNDMDDMRGGAIETCERLHGELSIKPSMGFFEKLISFECYSEEYCKEPSAAKIVKVMRQNGLVEDSAGGQYFYNTIKRIYGADWLGATEAVISYMGSEQFDLYKFFDMFPEYIARTRRRSRSMLCYI